MSSDATVLLRLTEALGNAAGVDDVAVAALRGVTALEGVTRAGLALTMVGGRQLRFLSSDEERLGPEPAWCLIDAYDVLPLNDAVRTGDDVVLESSASLARRYPDLAAHQDPEKVRSVVALPLTWVDQRLGGLLVYAERELAEDDDLRSLLSEVVARVTEALVTARTAQAATAPPAAGDQGPAAEAQPPSLTSSRLLPDDATAPATARRFLKQALADWGADEDVVDSALLCTSEIVTNVVMHVRRSSVITARRDGERLIVHVDQPASGADPVIRRTAAHDDPLVVAGRGLVLVDAIASRWGTESSPRSVRVWFELELASA